jgi:hypothetical protein
LDDGMIGMKDLLIKMKNDFMKLCQNYGLWGSGLNKLSFLSNVFCVMLHANKNIEYPKHFYQHELGKALDYK